MKIIIYATHDEGTFNQLSKHKNVVVLGFGSKWNGFIGKAKEILNYFRLSQRSRNDGRNQSGYFKKSAKTTNWLATMW